MKNVLVSFIALISVLAVSCKKGDEAKPATTSNPAAATTINVEYRIQGPSAQMVIDYIAPNASGVLESVHETLDRPSKTISFTYKTGNLFSVSASNSMPSHDVVQVQIYVNGTMVAENSTSNPSEKAIAQGNY